MTETSLFIFNALEVLSFFILLYLYQIICVLFEYFFGNLKKRKNIRSWFIPFYKPLKEYFIAANELAIYLEEKFHFNKPKSK